MMNGIVTEQKSKRSDMQELKVSCTFANDTTINYEYQDLVDLLIGEDADPPPKYFKIEAQGPQRQIVKILVSCYTGKAFVTIEPKPQ
jgi:hypothetical protein